MSDRSLSDVGGTSGGLGSFLMGFIMSCVGGYLLSTHVTVLGSYWSFYGGNTFGVTLIPMLFGIALLFWNGKSVLGWLLVLLVGGLGLIAKSLRHHAPPARD
jgi:hypothetical protein